MAKLSTFIISLIIAMLFISAGLIPLMADLNSHYNPSGYNESDISKYDRLSELNDDIEGVKEKAQELQSKSGVLDVLGGFFESGYDALRVAVGSFGVFNDMSDDAFDDLNVHGAGIFRTALILIAIVAIFLGIIISAVIKREM